MSILTTAAAVLVAAVSPTTAVWNRQWDAHWNKQFNRQFERRWHRRHRDPPMQTATASYYDLSGTGACGQPAQAGLAFANLSLPCGARVRFCYSGCVVGTMDDRGPYVTGRLFDLNVALKDTLGCPDLCQVRWRRIG